MKKSKFTLLWLLAVALFTITSCSEDDDNNPENTGETTSGYAVWLITNSSDFSGMLLTSDSMFTGEIEPTEASYKSLGYARNAGTSYDGDIYNVFNTSGDPGLQKYTYGNNTLTDDGFISVGESMFVYEVVSDEKGYYTDSDRSRTGIQTFNPSTMERTGEIDITSEIEPYITDSIALTRFGSFMIESEGYLYTEVFFLDASGYQYYDSTFVAVFDTETDEFVNLAIYPDFIWLGYERKNTNFVSKADNGDIYLASVVGNTNERQHSRCLRINAGETDFDDWILDYNDIIDDEGSFSLGGPAIVDDKLYIRLKSTGMEADYSNMMETNMYAYEVDIDTKEATVIDDIPASLSSVLYSVNGPSVINGLVYFAVSNSDYQGYYSYDPETEDVEEVFSFTGGIPSQFIAIE